MTGKLLHKITQKIVECNNVITTIQFTPGESIIYLKVKTFNYEKSINLNRKFIKSSIKLSRLYRKLGNKEKAIETLESALEYNPNKKILKKKLKRLKE